MNGKKLKELRKQLNLTQTGLAELIGRTSMRTIQNWESDKSAIPEYVEELLLKELSVTDTKDFVSENTKKDAPFEKRPIDEKLNILYQQNQEKIIQDNKIIEQNNKIIEQNKNILNVLNDVQEELDHTSIDSEIAFDLILKKIGVEKKKTSAASEKNKD